MITILHRAAVAALAVLLAGPALQVHFGLEYLYVYYVPAGVFATAVLISNLRTSGTIIDRIRESLIYLLLMFAGLFAFVSGALQETDLFVSVMTNVMLGMTVVMFPWREADIRAFCLALALVSSAIALNTVLFLNNDAALKLATDFQNEGYLAGTLLMAIGCLCAFFLVVDRFSVVTLGLLLLNWFGLALGRGRGSFLFCVLLTLVYLAVILFRRLPSFRAGKKTALLIAIGTAAPFVVTALFSFGLSEIKWERLLFNFGAEIEEGGRGDLMSEAIAMIGESWVFGHGLGASTEGDSHPHNIILQYGADGGAVSAGLLIVFLYMVFQRAYRAYSKADRYFVNATMVCGLLTTLVLLNLMKSGNAWINRDLFVIAAMPIVAWRIVRFRLQEIWRRNRLNAMRRAAVEEEDYDDAYHDEPDDRRPDLSDSQTVTVR